MKKINACIAVIVLTISTMVGQSSKIDKLFAEYESKEGVTIVNVPGALANAFACKDDKNNDISLEFVKIITIENNSLYPGLNFYTEIVPTLNMDEYRKIIQVTEAGQEVVIMYKSLKKKKLNEFLLITGGEDNTLIHIVGNFGVGDLKDFTNM